MTNKVQMAAVRRILTQFEKAVRLDENAGSLPPVQCAEARANYKAKRDAVEYFIESLLEMKNGEDSGSES